jgi:hypothetical protein
MHCKVLQIANLATATGCPAAAELRGATGASNPQPSAILRPWLPKIPARAALIDQVLQRKHAGLNGLNDRCRASNGVLLCLARKRFHHDADS